MSSTKENARLYLDKHLFDIKELISNIRNKNKSGNDESHLTTELIASNNGQAERLAQLKQETGHELKF